MVAQRNYQVDVKRGLALVKRVINGRVEPGHDELQRVCLTMHLAARRIKPRGARRC
jgi:hypothetical protein